MENVFIYLKKKFFLHNWSSLKLLKEKWMPCFEDRPMRGCRCLQTVFMLTNAAHHLTDTGNSVMAIVWLLSYSVKMFLHALFLKCSAWNRHSLSCFRPSRENRMEFKLLGHLLGHGIDLTIFHALLIYINLILYVKAFFRNHLRDSNLSEN